MMCDYCDRTLRQDDYYYRIAGEILCEDCIEDSRRTYDPQGDQMDILYEESKERD